jgi:hypothetical protein
VIKLNENEELLIIIHDNTKMGLSSTKKLITLLKDKENKIKYLLEEELQSYEKYFKECKKLIKKEKIKAEHKGLLKNLTANTAMKTEVNKDNSDSKIASILTRGFTMGNIDMETKIKSFKKEANKETIKLAEEILKFGEKQIELLKNYL